MTDKNRRKFVTMVGASAAVIPLTALVGTLPSYADGHLPMVDPESAQATALQYMEESDKPEQNCANCTLYQGKVDGKAGPCPLFPGNEVTAAGWCSAYVPKA